MAQHVAETFQHNGYTIKIIQDSDAESPQEWVGIDLFIVTTRNRYFEMLHDGQDVHQVMEDKEFCRKYWIFPVFAYIHSGVALSLGRGGQFSDPWDSGQIGFVFATKSEWKYQTRETKKCCSAYKAASLHTEVWNQYLAGDVWGFVIESPDGDDIDSCWGFYGMENCKEAARNSCPDEPALVGGESEDNAHEDSLT